MPVTIDDMIERLDAFDVDSAVIDSLEQNTDLMVRYQVDQLLHGLRQDGKKIGKYKRGPYAVKKYIQNPLAGFGNMDWILTGDLKKELFALIKNDEIEIDSLDIKADFLIKRLGDPFGLTDQNDQKLIDGRLGDSFNTVVHSKLNL